MPVLGKVLTISAFIYEKALVEQDGVLSAIRIVDIVHLLKAAAVN